MVFDSADLDCRAFVFPRNPADIFPNTIFNVLSNPFVAILCAKHDVDMFIEKPAASTVEDAKIMADAIKAKNLNEFLHALQLRYANMDKTSTFKIYEVKENLKQFTTTLKDRRYGIFKLPSEEFRKRDQEIQGTEELKKNESDDDNSEEENIKAIDCNQPTIGG